MRVKQASERAAAALSPRVCARGKQPGSARGVGANHTLLQDRTMTSVAPSRVVVAHQAHARKMSSGGTSTSTSRATVFGVPAATAVRSNRRAVGALQLPRRYPAVRRRGGVVGQGRESSQSAHGERSTFFSPFISRHLL